MPNNRVSTKKFGFGIVDRDGNPYWGEACVEDDRRVLDTEVCWYLNHDDIADQRRPYRVVALWHKQKPASRRR